MIFGTSVSSRGEGNPCSQDKLDENHVFNIEMEVDGSPKAGSKLLKSAGKASGQKFLDVQREFEAQRLGRLADAVAALLKTKPRKRFERVVADRRQADTLLLQQMPGVFQPDQLGAAVLSPVRATVKN
jgi:hypothetical protein